MSTKNFMETETEINSHTTSDNIELPKYEKDDGPITQSQIEAFEKISGINDFVPTKSIFRYSHQRNFKKLPSRCAGQF